MTTIIYDETGDNDYRLYEEGSYLGGSLTLDYILLQETSTSSFTQHQASTSLETGVSFASAGNNQNTSQSDASLQSVLFPGNLLANVDVESEGSTESAAFDSGETYGYVRSSSSVADRSGASSYTLLEEGSFAGTLSLDWIVLDRQSTSSYASLGTTVEMRSSAAENSHTFGSGLSETLASFAPGAGTYSYAGAENQGWNTSSASSFSSTSTSTYQDVGTSSYTLRQEGDYDGGSLSLSCYVLSQGSASSSTRHQEMSRTDSSTTSRERTTGGTETAMFDEGGTFHVSIGTYSATISETFTFDSTSSSSHDSGSTSSMSLYQLGSFSGGSFSLVSISYREGSQGSYSSHEGSAWSYGGDAVGGGHSSQDQASASSMSWLAAGSFANGDVNLSCFAYDTGSQSSFTSHGEGTFATGSTGESYVQDSTSASSMSLHERGIYGGGSFSLSSYALQQGGTSSYTMHSASSFTSASDSNSSTRDAISRGSFSLSAVGSYALGSFQFSSYLRNEASLSSYAMHAEGLHTTSDGTTSFVQDGLSVESLLLHENGSYAGGVLSLSSYSYVTGSLESLGWHETVQNSAFTRTRSDGLIEAAERAEVGSFSLGSSAWSETGTQSSNIQVSVGTFIWNSPSLDSYSRSGGGTFTLKREVQGTQLFTEIPTGLTTPERVSDLQQKAQELTNGIDANGLVQRLQGEMGFLMEEARRAASTAVNVIDLNGAKPVAGLTNASLVLDGLILEGSALTHWAQRVRTHAVRIATVGPQILAQSLHGLDGSSALENLEISDFLRNGQPETVFTLPTSGWPATIKERSIEATETTAPQPAGSTQIDEGHPFKNELPSTRPADTSRPDPLVDPSGTLLLPRMELTRPPVSPQNDVAKIDYDALRRFDEPRINKAPEKLRAELRTYLDKLRGASADEKEELTRDISIALREHQRVHGTPNQQKLIGLVEADEDRFDYLIKLMNERKAVTIDGSVMGLAADELGDFFLGILKGFKDGAVGTVTSIPEMAVMTFKAAKAMERHLLGYIIDFEKQKAEDLKMLEPVQEAMMFLDLAQREFSTNPNLVMQAALTGNVEVLDRIAPHFKVVFLLARDLVIESTISLVSMSASKKGEVVGLILYEVTETVALAAVSAGTKGAAAVPSVALKIGKIAKYIHQAKELLSATKFVKAFEWLIEKAKGGFKALQAAAKAIEVKLVASVTRRINRVRIVSYIKEAETALGQARKLSKALEEAKLAGDAAKVVKLTKEIDELAKIAKDAEKAGKELKHVTKEAEKLSQHAREAEKLAETAKKEAKHAEEAAKKVKGETPHAGDGGKKPPNDKPPTTGEGPSNAGNSGGGGGARKLSSKAKDLLDGKNVVVDTIKEADALLKEALPNAKKVIGTGPGQTTPPDWSKFKGKDPKGMYHKDYQFDPKTGRIYGHGPNNPHATNKHINIKLPDGRKVTITIRRK